MSKQITIFVFRENCARTRSLSVSTRQIASLLSFLAAGVAVVAALLIDYRSLRQVQGTTFNMRRKLTLQQEEILRQRKQIKYFANEINKLKSYLITFHDFESKIRILSNIETPNESGSLFGIGGPIPLSIEADTPINESHNELLREMHAQLKQVDEAAKVQQQGFTSLLAYLEDQRSLLSSTPSIWPTDGWVSSEFGYRQSPFTGLREFHKGIDIAASNGQAIYATGDGIVTYAGSKGTMGKMIVINHGHGMATRYGHLKKFSKKEGDRLKRGDIIGWVGASGRTTGPHLHYEVLIDGVPVKPGKYILE